MQHYDTWKTGLIGLVVNQDIAHLGLREARGDENTTTPKYNVHEVVVALTP